MTRLLFSFSVQLLVISLWMKIGWNPKYKKYQGETVFLNWKYANRWTCSQLKIELLCLECNHCIFSWLASYSHQILVTCSMAELAKLNKQQMKQKKQLKQQKSSSFQALWLQKPTLTVCLLKMSQKHKNGACSMPGMYRSRYLWMSPLGKLRETVSRKLL